MRTCNVGARRAFVPCIPWRRFIAVLPFAPVSIICAVAFSHAFCPFALSYLLPFTVVRFLPYVCPQTVSRFIAYGFLGVLSGLFVCRIYLHRLPYFVRLCSLISGKFAVLGEYRGGVPLR